MFTFWFDSEVDRDIGNLDKSHKFFVKNKVKAHKMARLLHLTHIDDDIDCDGHVGYYKIEKSSFPANDDKDYASELCERLEDFKEEIGRFLNE